MEIREVGKSRNNENSKMKKQERLEIVRAIKYELAEGIHTFTMCECGKHSARSHKCWECYLEEFL